MANSRSKPMTSGELMRQLQSDPAWVRANAEREAERRAIRARISAELAPEQEPLIADILAVGIRIISVWDLVNTADL